MSTVGKRFEERFTGVKLGIDEVLGLIEKNGGSKGLDLSGKLGFSQYSSRPRAGVLSSFKAMRLFFVLVVAFWIASFFLTR
jgi:hypothetical protein